MHQAVVKDSQNAIINAKLQVLFLRADNIQDDDVKQMCQALKPDPVNPLATKPLKVLDISYNPLTSLSVQYLSELLDVNRQLEYIGIAKCGLQAHHAVRLFEQIGRLPFPQDQVEAHQAKMKARDAIIEKNKKLKATKKPEEPVPQLDLIEQSTYLNAEGAEVTGWVLLKNTQFKHVNLCANEIGDECKESVAALLRRTQDDFGITLAGNPISKPIVETLSKVALELHQTRVPADQVDSLIAVRRLAF